MRSLARPKILFSFRPPPKQTVRAFFFFRADISRFKSNFSRRCVSARSSGRFAFSNQSVLTVFFRGSPFRNAGFFQKPKATVSPKTQKLWLSFAKIRPFLNPQAVVPHVFQPAPELKGTSFKSESDWIVESKKIITTEHSPNIAINFLDRRFLQSRLDSAVFPQKTQTERPLLVRDISRFASVKLRVIKNYRALILAERRETVREAVFFGSTPFWAALISSDSATIKAALAASLLFSRMAALTFLTKVRTRLLRAPLIMLLLLFLLILVLPIYDWPYLFILY